VEAVAMLRDLLRSARPFHQKAMPLLASLDHLASGES
jgi:hypothetical protein